MTIRYFPHSCTIAALLFLPAFSATQPLKRDINGIALGMTMKDVEGLKLKNCQAGSRVSIYCNDGQYSVRLSEKNRIYEIRISPCNTYTCKDVDPAALVKQLEGDYGVHLESLIAGAYFGRRDDITVGFSFSGELWHIGIVDQKIQMDDSTLK